MVSTRTLSASTLHERMTHSSPRSPALCTLHPTHAMHAEALAEHYGIKVRRKARDWG